MNLNSSIQIEQERRLCIVNGDTCLFHGWFQYYDVIEPSLMIGGHPGGQLAYPVGVVEFPDGSVGKVKPKDIKFVDEINHILYVTDTHRKAEEERKGE